MKKLLLLFFGIIVFTGCNNHLTRDNALKLISRKFNQPVTIRLQHGEVNYGGFMAADVSTEKTLEENKLITFEYRGRVFGFGTYEKYYLELTPEGQKYRIGETSDNEGRQFYLMKVADIAVIEITGIIETNEGKTAQVDYTWKYDNLTHFGEVYSKINQRLNRNSIYSNEKVYNDGKVYSERIMIVKYDDGWRIE